MFLLAIDKVCKLHGMSIAHEDEQGAFLVRNYKRSYRNWLYEARDRVIKPTTKVING